MPLKLNGDGWQTRGFTFVDDIAAGTILGLEPVGYQVFNLGGHESISMNALIARLEALIGKRAVIERGPSERADMAANLADISKARPSAPTPGSERHFSMQRLLVGLRLDLVLP